MWPCVLAGNAGDPDMLHHGADDHDSSGSWPPSRSLRGRQRRACLRARLWRFGPIGRDALQLLVSIHPIKVSLSPPEAIQANKAHSTRTISPAATDPMMVGSSWLKRGLDVDLFR